MRRRRWRREGEKDEDAGDQGDGGGGKEDDSDDGGDGGEEMPADGNLRDLHHIAHFAPPVRDLIDAEWRHKVCARHMPEPV